MVPAMNRALTLLVVLAACGHEDDLTADTNACEAFAGGDTAAVTATASKDSATPSVTGDHRVYVVTLPASGIGYLRFTAPESTEFAIFLDRAVPFAVQNDQSMPVALDSSATSSEACTTIQGKHVVSLPAGPAFFALGPDAGGPVNLVVDLAGGHSH